MKKLLNRIFDNEILAYLIFGVATTIVSVATRLIVFQLTDQEQLATLIGNIAGILFAFATNDTIVFKQERKGWLKRLIDFSFARMGTLVLDLLMTTIFVTQYPQINTIETFAAQFMIVILNYVFSKLFVFRNKK